MSTPNSLPWERKGFYIVDAEHSVQIANVAPGYGDAAEVGDFIVRAANAHRELLIALRDMVRGCDSGWFVIQLDDSARHETPLHERASAALAAARNAIATAEGRTA